MDMVLDQAWDRDRDTAPDMDLALAWGPAVGLE